MSSRLVKATLATLLLATASLVQAEVKTVAVTQIVEHPALDAVYQGVRDELTENAGYRVGETIEFMHESAQANTATASQIARKFVGAQPDVIVAIATPSAQTVAAAARKTPVVFSAVTDPVGAKLVDSMEKPGGNITGITDMLPIDHHLDMLQRVMPDANRIGTVYNPGEANAVALVDEIEKRFKERDVELVKAAATKTSEVLGAARSLVGKVDAIYITTDNTVVSAAEAVMSVGERADIPVFAADTATAERGAVAALGFNYYDMGRQTGQVVNRILKGEAPASIPVRGIDKLSLHVNPGAAKRMGITLPQSFVDDADKVISE